MLGAPAMGVKAARGRARGGRKGTQNREIQRFSRTLARLAPISGPGRSFSIARRFLIMKGPRSWSHPDSLARHFATLAVTGGWPGGTNNYECHVLMPALSPGEPQR